jgi:hypothetical protein
MKELKFSKTKLNLWTVLPNGKYKLVKIPMKYKAKYLEHFSTLIVHPTEVIETWLYKQQQIYYVK